MEPDLVVIASKRIGVKPVHDGGSTKTVRRVTLYQHSPATDTVKEVGQEILLKRKNSLREGKVQRAEASIKKEIEFFKSGKIPCTPPFIGEFTYQGRNGVQKVAYVSKRFDGDLFKFFITPLAVNKRICLEALIKVVEILAAWREEKLIHLDLSAGNFVYRLKGKYDVLSDGTVYKPNPDSTLYKIAPDGKVYHIIDGKERPIKKDDIVEIDVCIIDVATTQEVNASTTITSWLQSASWTPAYLAPEYARIILNKGNDTNQVLQNSDIFSVGTIICFILMPLYQWRHPLLEALKADRWEIPRIIQVKREWQDLNPQDNNGSPLWQVVCGMLKNEPAERMLPAQALPIMKEELKQF
jgi:serine/threonine protein kinase